MWFQDINYIKLVQGCKYYRHSIIIAKRKYDVKLYTTGRIWEGLRGGKTNNTLSDKQAR